MRRSQRRRKDPSEEGDEQGIPGKHKDLSKGSSEQRGNVLRAETRARKAGRGGWWEVRCYSRPSPRGKGPAGQNLNLNNKDIQEDGGRERYSGNQSPCCPPVPTSSPFLKRWNKSGILMDPPACIV